MTGVLTVSLPTDERFSKKYGAVLASLPARFQVTAAGGAGADIVVVACRTRADVDAARAAIDVGAGAMVLDSPPTDDTAGLRDLARAATHAGVVVAVDTAYAGDRTWRSELNRLRDDLEDAVLLDSVVSGAPGDNGPDSLDRAALDQLAIFRSLAGPVLPAQVVSRRSVTDYLVAGLAGRTAISLTGLVGSGRPPGLSLDIVGVERRWRIRFDGTGIARSAEVTLYDGTGRHTNRPLYENRRRSFWRDIHQALADNTTAVHTLNDYLAALNMARLLSLDPPIRP